MREERPKRTRLRWFVPALIAGVATVIAVELLAVLVYPVTADQPYSRSRIQSGLAKRKAHLICLAVDGFKQPQPLFSLAFAIYLGAEYDVVINLDGFNEVVLPFTDNLPNKVFPHYPRIWNFYADKGLSLTHVAQVAELMSLRKRQ